MESGYVNANEKVWGLDGTLMYHADTSRGTIWEYNYDPSAGTISGRRIFVTQPGESPDGLSIDQDGNIIAAMYGGGCLKIFRTEAMSWARLICQFPIRIAAFWQGRSCTSRLHMMG
ncbi:SMP-30/Gluconolaconase/LRE-like region-containing protein [Rhizobium sp. NFR07]|nr:SMP-30/Gluconolaconase/LRE-like region-containing protein [Rhizobium sp. NFR07]